MFVLFCYSLIAIAKAAPYVEDIGGYEGPGEFGDKFEGDMILNREQKKAITDAQDSRNGLKGGAKRWPEKVVVYYIDDEEFEEDDIKIIKEAMADIARNSCVKFRERKDKDEHAVIFQNSGSGCYSSVGYNTEPDEEGNLSQVLNLSKGCCKRGTIIHEMLHTLGFYHMQSTYDRDDYVEVVYENIKAGTEHNFVKYSNDTVTDFGVPYDYGSVMHYPETAFSKNGNKTIIPLQEGAVIGQREGLSESDILKLNRMYCEKDDGVKMSYRPYLNKVMQGL